MAVCREYAVVSAYGNPGLGVPHPGLWRFEGTFSADSTLDITANTHFSNSIVASYTTFLQNLHSLTENKTRLTNSKIPVTYRTFFLRYEMVKLRLRPGC